jgi:hypothetical protein
MKYTIETIIELPRDKVIKKLDNTDNLKHWQEGLVSTEHISGTPGQVGAKMKLVFKMGKRHMELIENITKRAFPNEFHSTYSTKGMHNVQENYFEELPNGHTKWVSKSEFIPTNFVLRIMTLIMPSTFKKQSKKYMDAFKNFAEKGISINNL